MTDLLVAIVVFGKSSGVLGKVLYWEAPTLYL